MKICILSQSLYTLGGIQRVLSTILNELVINNDIEITVLMPKLDNEENIFNINEKIKIINTICYEQKKITSLIFRLLRKINQKTAIFDKLKLNKLIEKFILLPGMRKKYLNELSGKYDVIVGVGCWYSLLLSILGPQLKCKKIGWMHSTYEAYFLKKGNQTYGYLNFFKKYCKNLDEILVLTESDKRDFDYRLKYNTRVLYNPVSQKFLKGKREYHGGHNILFVGRMSMECKGLDYLIPLAKNLSKIYSDIKFTVVGDGPDKIKFENMIIESKLENFFDIVGMQKNVDEYYLKSDLLVVTSRWEGFGLVLAEAMGCGTPVVAFENKGPNEIIGNCYGGILVKKYDIEEFTNTIKSLFEDEKKWNDLSESAFIRAKDFSAKATVSKFLNYIIEGGKKNE